MPASCVPALAVAKFPPSRPNINYGGKNGPFPFLTTIPKSAIPLGPTRANVHQKLCFSQTDHPAAAASAQVCLAQLPPNLFNFLRSEIQRTVRAVYHKPPQLFPVGPSPLLLVVAYNKPLSAGTQQIAEPGCDPPLLGHPCASIPPVL